MTQTQTPLEEWYITYKPLLFSIAYRMLGSMSEAEDIVQDSFIAASKTQTAEVLNVKAYLCKTVTNRCIDYLKSAKIRRETYVGPWLPEPMNSGEGEDPVYRAAVREDITYAFLHLMERLNPMERAIFVLREAFDYDYSEIAGMLDRSEAACRKTFSRLKHKLADVGTSAVPIVRGQETMPLIESFMQAIATGNTSQFIARLTADIVLYTDGGGKVRAALNPIIGPDRVAAFLFGIAGKRDLANRLSPAVFNGSPALIIGSYEDRTPMIMLFDWAEDCIRRIYIVSNPDKIAHLGLT